MRTLLVFVAALACTGNASALCLNHTTYIPTFDDEFNTFSRANNTINSGGTWQTKYSWGRTNNTDANYYSDFASDAWDGFNLKTPGDLQMKSDNAPGWLTGTITPYTYAGSVMTTRYSFSQVYGYFEASMQNPSGQGLWPAFWMLPIGAGKPEIDIMEMLGQAPTQIYQGAWDKSSVDHSSGALTPGFDSSQGFHRYGAEWKPDGTVGFYIDGTLQYTATNIFAGNPMYLLLSNQIGASGSWPGQPNGSTPFPSVLQVQYVRAYQATNSSC